MVYLNSSTFPSYYNLTGREKTYYLEMSEFLVFPGRCEYFEGMNLNPVSLSLNFRYFKGINMESKAGTIIRSQERSSQSLWLFECPYVPGCFCLQREIKMRNHGSYKEENHVMGETVRIASTQPSTLIS